MGTTAIVNVRDTVSPEAREMLRETLGDLGLSRLTALSDMTNRGVIDRVTTGSFGGEPLSQPQVLWLIDTLSARVERQDPSTGFKYDTPDWDRLLLEAPAKFGPAQVTHLRALVQAERERRADSLQRLKLRTKQ